MKRYLILALLGFAPIFAGAQTSNMARVIAREMLRVGSDTSKYFTSITHSVTAASTNRQAPTAKAVFDAISNRTDSTFVKISGSYANKRITDNIYKTGTLGLRTTDTTGVLTIQQDETGSKPSLYLAGNQETLLRLQADSNGDSISHWGIYRQFFDNASSVGDNQVVSIGFNTFSGGGQDDPTKGMMRIGMEEKFTYGTYPAFELHVPEIRTKAGATRRPLTGLFGHDLAGGGVWTFQSDHIVFQDYKTAGNDVTWGFGTNGAYPKGIVFSDTASISFGKSLSGSAINFRNAANSAYVNALTLNSSNEVALGTTAAGINILPASIKLNSSPKLFTADGSGVAIGYSSFPNDLDVYGASQSLFRLRNSLETKGWYLRVGASAFDLYTPTNTAALVVSETAPNYSLSLKSDGDVGLGILTPLSRAHIYTSSGATKSMIRLQNSAHAADVFTTNATPEGAITAPVGSIALSNISSAGGLWIKETGAGTTGWNNVATGLAANTAKSYYLTRTLPASGSTIHLGVLNHSGGGGGYCELHCVVNNGSGNAIAKKYLIPLAFSNTGGVWQNLLPIASTGAYIGNDFKIEMKNSSTRDTLRVRTVSGSTGGTLLVSLYMYPYQGSASTFVETTTAETPTAVTATFQKMPWSAEANLAGINTLNPLGALHVTGTGATSSTYALRVQNSSSTNQFCIRNDGRTGIGNVTAPANVLDVEGAAVIGATYSGSSAAATNGLLVEGSTSIGNTSPGAKLHVTGAGTTSSTYSGIFEKSDGTDVLVVRDDGKVAIANDGFNEALNVNGQVRADAVDIRSWETTDNTNDGELHYEDGDGQTAYLTIGAGERRFPILPHMIQLQAIDYNVDWTTGRTKAFWTVPARFNGWKVSKVYVSVSSIGSVTGNVVEIEKGGVGITTQTISSASHTVTIDNSIATDDIFTFDITSVGATASKGLFVEIELRHN